jgi:hypothetical protein
MKKFLLIVGGFIVVVLLAAAVLPFIYKDDIKAALDDAIAENVNAKVYFDESRFGLTLFKNFPNLTVTLGGLGVVGIDEFKKDTLAAVDQVDVVVNIMSVINGNYRISGLYLNEPNIYVKVLANGKANYDIAKPSEEPVAEEAPTESGDVQFGIDKWEIKNGNIVYDDATIPFYMAMKGMNHTGSGDFTLEVFDMDTYTEIENLVVSYDGVEYMSDKRLKADMALNMDLGQMKFTFKDNVVSLNDFGLNFDGYFAMPKEGYDMDISFSSPENSFKSLLSLVPGMYSDSFTGLTASGDTQFSGFVKGIYNDTQMPAFNFGMKVIDGNFKYPELPSAVSNVNVDMLIDCADGNIDNTLVDIKQFHLDFGNNPVDAKLTIKNLVNYDMVADIQAKLNLGELATMFPMEGLEMKGMFSMNAKSQGVYDSIANTIPTIDMEMGLADVFIKYAEYPIPMEQMNMHTTIKNESGKMAETVVLMDKFTMLVDGEKLESTLRFENLDDYTWDLAVNGGIDLEKIMQIFPMEGMELKGKIGANMQTKGKMSDVDAERYDKLATSGGMTVSNFYYADADLPQGFAISESELSFNPKEVRLSKFNATLGRSDMAMTGAITNYMAYVMNDETIKGELNFSSNSFDLNEWMTDEDTTATVEADTATLEVVEVPKNIDFILRSSITSLLYDNMEIKNMKGNIIVKDGVVKLDNGKFNLMDGQFAMDGEYDTRDLEKPLFAFDFSITDMSIKAAYNTFTTVQQLAPIAEKMEGKFSTDFVMAGALGQDMMPVMESILGQGVVKVAEGKVNDLKVLTALSSVSKLGDDSGTLSLKDVIMQAEIRDGRVWLKPFDVNVGKYKTTIAGSNGIDGTMDYVMAMNVPAGAASAAANQAIASVTGVSSAISSNIVMNFGVGGTYDDPKVTLKSVDAGEGGKSATDAAKAKIASEMDAKKQEATKKAEEAKAEAIKQAEEKKEAVVKEVEEKKEAAKEEVKEQVEEKKEEVKEEAADKLKGLLKKKKGGGE